MLSTSTTLSVLHNVTAAKDLAGQSEEEPCSSHTVAKEMVLSPEEAITRYKRVREAVNKGNNKTAAYRAVGVDRKTIADTAEIAELHAVNPAIFQDLRGTLKKGETLLRFSEK
ncbi:hypothetical protein JOQ06_018901 [Pogonophryne albipinna]|uniref:Uncharacterized protein n=1 Tax=Pogonophryne albipinna TaxID=1090488 RepID=A0AAD6ARW4_9TELE|nr:hypothetical protein JOQ06_018901 [Pogonophryne albipinna]